MTNPVFIRDLTSPECPIRNVLARIADKWSLLVLYTLSQQNDPMRFKALQRAIPDISQKMLTSTLRTLEQDGFIVRKAYAEVPPRVEYQSTERAASLMPHLNALFGWAIDHMQSILRDREVYTAKGNES
ncbi:winged helix-turn-helix transcriptional regulator [Lepagella muris]|jgi:DNA-binding HxlR family transcriptional regulator|uniref:Transcriptional regulator n=2 Tax=Bacteria TaxID=2 RepID=A0AC61RFL9_9BACT|nr:helix-turn-helix domain-containing protein [Lepagella muris]ROT02601.1 transcriptional regulator [Muribaculaceae bacterium Isolate-037 (Harlan)]TGY76786.1 transcriptional regulator [Lepagella muris]THG47901.1 transcriptional regulator [Bacteroidales bacterium]TKC54546.1 transcriptional regulator [Bacteroidales bacterium]